MKNTKRNYRSEAAEAIHETMEGLYSIGAISKTTMREFDERCLLQAATLTPQQIRKLPIRRRQLPHRHAPSGASLLRHLAHLHRSKLPLLQFRETFDGFLDGQPREIATQFFELLDEVPLQLGQLLRGAPCVGPEDDHALELLFQLFEADVRLFLLCEHRLDGSLGKMLGRLAGRLERRLPGFRLDPQVQIAVEEAVRLKEKAATLASTTATRASTDTSVSRSLRIRPGAAALTGAPEKITMRKASTP